MRSLRVNSFAHTRSGVFKAASGLPYAASQQSIRKVRFPVRLVPLPQPGDQWCYEVRTAVRDPLAQRLFAYLAREGVPFLGPTDGAHARVGPLHAEQALQFESHWRPYVAA